MSNYKQLPSPPPRDNLESFSPELITSLIPEQILTSVSNCLTSPQDLAAPAAILTLTSRQVTTLPSNSQQVFAPTAIHSLTPQQLSALAVPTATSSTTRQDFVSTLTLSSTSQRVLAPTGVPPSTSSQVFASLATTSTQQAIDTAAILTYQQAPAQTTASLSIFQSGLIQGNNVFLLNSTHTLDTPNFIDVLFKGDIGWWKNE
ncbi:4603_t:CDS:1 [Acaulospora morrowiae]|uniref:4603_t:CDS:1 n=1 Tax=Acaulospora morrowiae TaxID=94023 RepID=A0A9N9FL36_9GLOM|nr:4603_t:CDS:1 [Acaulospora morrowiae]